MSHHKDQRKNKLMKRIMFVIVWGTIFFISPNVHGQNNENCFLNDFKPKSAEILPVADAVKPVDPASVVVTIPGDTLGKISQYVFGNAIAAWAGAHNNPTFIDGVTLLAPTLIRFPGGSWSDGYFWNGVPTDVPDSVYDGTSYNSSTKTAIKNKFWGQTGIGGWQTTRDQYYALRENTNVTGGLITINYAYARYGTSKNPVAQAAHLAADWVRYDAGRTKFWEIGNENGGPWEYGWMIDTALNQDGQPQFISGALYGKHFKVFVDSMRNAAKEIGDTIYIGGQVIAAPPSSGGEWRTVEDNWNAGFFKEAGDSADFYIVHNYFSNSGSVSSIITGAQSSLRANGDYVKKEILNKKGSLKPLALTEYNMNSGNLAVSYVNGMQAVVLICELIKNNFGLGARWLLISGESTMFYGGSDANYLNHPHADFYYLSYLQKFCGDHAISAISSNSNILCYASKFSSGETGVIVINDGTTKKVINIDTKAMGVGRHYNVLSFTGGTDNGDLSQNVFINGDGPAEYQWGPYGDMYGIPAYSYLTEGGLKFESPGKSVQMILIEGGNNYITSVDNSTKEIPRSYNLYQNYPNPFNPSTSISYQLPASVFVTLKVYDVLGREIDVLVNEHQSVGDHSVQFNGVNLPSGVYFYRLQAGTYSAVNKFMLVK
jgi:hypothetical protein